MLTIKRNKKGQFVEGYQKHQKNLLKKGLRKCWRCEKVLTLSEENFYRSKNEIGGFQYICKNCVRVYRREGYQKNKEKEKRYQRRYYKNNKEYCKQWAREYNKSVRGRYYRYRSDAKKRNLSWELTLEDFERIVKQPCSYCGIDSSKRLIGVDRKDNKKGYSVDNSVPCCEIHNMMKKEMSVKEFIEECGKVVRYKKIK